MSSTSTICEAVPLIRAAVRGSAGAPSGNRRDGPAAGNVLRKPIAGISFALMYWARDAISATLTNQRLAATLAFTMVGLYLIIWAFAIVALFGMGAMFALSAFSLEEQPALLQHIIRLQDDGKGFQNFVRQPTKLARNHIRC